MADIATLNSIYNHYLTSYAPKTNTSTETHKKSELRGIYNSIVKINKESPLYLLDDSAESKAFAIGLKEDARQLHQTISSLGGLDEAELLNKKTAYSSNESIATAKFVGSVEDAATAPDLEIEVQSLASPQENLGKFLISEETTGLPADTYSFDLSINDFNYEFQFQIRANDTNIDVQERLERLINNADVGVKAEVVDDALGDSALKLSSQKSGTSLDQDLVFKISDHATSKRNGAVSYFGLSDVSREPSNANFVINGMERSASSNSFTVENMYEITLNGVSPEEGEITSIGLKTDSESLLENMRSLFDGYNSFLKSAIDYTAKHPKSSQLVSEMWHIAGNYAKDLQSVGIDINEDGTVSLDTERMEQSIDDGAMADGFDSIKSFAKSIYRKSNQVALNPMNYVDKTIVAYKNPGKNYATPYITSSYSGMMFNSYC